MQQQEQSLPSDLRTIPGAEFLDPDRLRATLKQVADHRGTANLRPVAGQWHKHYTAALLDPILPAMTVGGVGLNGAMPNASVVLDATGMPTSMILTDPAPLPAGPDLRRAVLEGVREHHLAPLIDQLRNVTGIPRRILWTNVANRVAEIYDKLARRAEVPEAVAEDRWLLLDSPVDLLTGEANPLYGLVRYEPVEMPGLPPSVRCRQACCQRYLLPNDKPCASCPRRSPAERIEAVQAKLMKRKG